jgi:hypothetical protein
MKRIGEILVENNLISLDSLNDALKEIRLFSTNISPIRFIFTP